MSKLIGTAIGAMLFVLYQANLARDRFSQYKAVEAYEIRPGILMIPTYSADGLVCEIGLEKLHYSREKIRLDSSISRNRMKDLFRGQQNRTQLRTIRTVPLPNFRASLGLCRKSWG